MVAMENLVPHAVFFHCKCSLLGFIVHANVCVCVCVCSMNEAPDVAMCNYRKDNTTIFAQDECLPQNVDWFGYDFYQDDSLSWTVRACALHPRIKIPTSHLLTLSIA